MSRQGRDNSRRSTRARDGYSPPMDEANRRAGREALDRKAAEAREKDRRARAEAEERSTVADDRPPGDVDPRTKSSRHGQVTADKWNQ
jgi:hypothetical protein